MLTRHLVEGTERLVHQQQLRMRRQRPGDGDALLHTSRELPRHVSGEIRELYELEHFLGAGRRLALSQPFNSSGSSTFFSTVRQSNKPACWKAIP